MAFAGIMFVFYEDAPKLSRSGDLIYGRVISSAVDVAISGTVDLAIPLNCTYLSVLSDAVVYTLIGVGAQTVTEGAKADVVPASQRTDFTVGSLEDNISYKAA